ncbi:MAG: hypothetical protein VYD19_07470 [Myxococcota bacterium]|nr:hypothetical protein [Myxococcota bacterium]
MALFGNQTKQLVAKIDELREQNRQLQAEAAKAKRDLKAGRRELQSERQNAQQERQALASSLKSEKGKIAGLHERISQLKSQVETQRESL